MTRSCLLVAVLCSAAEGLRVDPPTIESACVSKETGECSEPQPAPARITRATSLLQVKSGRKQRGMAPNQSDADDSDDDDDLATNASCSLPCNFAGAAHTCKARTFWVFGSDTLEHTGNLTSALGLVNEQCAGQCFCTEDEFLQLEETNCSSQCSFATTTHTCRERVLWSLHTSESLSMSEALDIVNDDCIGQCNCEVADFPILVHQPPELPCWTAEEGDECFAAVEWVLTHGVRLHPEAYDGLTAGSPWDQVQEFMNKRGLGNCRKPCDVCHTAEAGEACYTAVQDLMTARNLSNVSAFEDIQDSLNRTDNESACPRPCRSCRSVEVGELCHLSVVWAMEQGIFESPEWYPGLSSKSSFEDFQTLLHRGGLHRCPLPCSALSVPTPGSDSAL